MDSLGPNGSLDEPHQPNPYAPPPAPAAPFVTVPKTNTLAILSFASSFFIGLVAIITGHIALGQIRARGELGRGFALAGLIIGYLRVAVTAILLVLLIVFASAVGAFFIALNADLTSSAPSAPTEPTEPTESTAPLEPTESTAPLPTGQLGAANFDGGYLEFGTGAVIIDEYVDPMCPFCAQFEQTNGDLLAAGVASGVITLRVHSLTFLDRLSEGTNYSSRASAALTCQATLNPDQTLEFLAALFANQPLEETAGLSNRELADLAPGAVSIADCAEAGDYQGWSQHNTEVALKGPIEGAEVASIKGTPTVLVDGALYTGSNIDLAEFQAFVATAFS
ncbi:DUF4190 domain-containing protein [Cryobacterium suzukii]|uniref:DUF4190 domain-containing protein n=1 Tax=Cryobacterium suzukii TaxID=1259198 RepID=A0A4V3ISZ0_9MICO|nr:thioredoxin domain-containing protein [Cryobacterium suzukii]TFD62871.1 DUF4190 domain-containing protein [Cryobacterium suzukii]